MKKYVPIATTWLVPVFIFLVTVTAFLPAVHNGFVLWDDDINILENRNYRGLGWSELRWMFTTFHAGHYQPLSWMTLGADYLLWGMNPSGYHLTNVILHALGAVLFYFVSQRLLCAAFPRANDRAVRGSAAFAALFFSLHPLRVESVAWVTERRDVLSGLFLFAALLAYLRAIENGSRRWWLGGAIVFYALSLLSKAGGMSLPIVLVILDIYPFRRLPGAPREWFVKATRPIWLEKIPFFVLAAGAAALAVTAQRESGALLSVAAYGIGRRLGQILYSLLFYPWKTVAPTHLAPIYELLLRGDGGSLRWLAAGTAIVAALAGIVFSLRKKYPALVAAAVCYLALVAPVSGIAQSGIQFVADRYSYLACLSWALLAAGVGYTLQSKWKPYPVWIGGIGILVLLGVATWKQTLIWRDSAALWRHAVAVQPASSFAHYNLGLVLFRQGEIETAKLEYEEALRLNPEDAETHNNLGLLLATRGEMDAAMRHFHAAVRIDPRYAKAYYNIGRVLLRQGRAADAVAYFNIALTLAPGTAEIHEQLGKAFAVQGRNEEAVRHLEEAVRIMKAKSASR